MNRNNDSIKASVVGLFLIAAIVAGCNTSSGTGTVGGANPLNPNNAPSSTQKIHIHDDGDNGTFIGTYTPAPCWTVSPHPLPGYGQPETKTFWVTYAPDSCSERDITITYYSQGFGSQTYPCFYKITYPVDGSWKYSATAGPYTACSVATAAPSANYDENLYFKIVDTEAGVKRFLKPR